MSLNDFEIIKRLGEGAYSSVYHVRRIADGDYYALKKVRMQKLSDKEKENALNEVRILASIRHPNIVAYKEAFIDEASQSLCIVMEYADSGDLYLQICDHQKNNTLFKEDDIWKMFIQMVRGLRCLHEILIFHRDLKSANIFLNKDGTAKLGDMNVSKVAKKGMLYTQTGTPYYASPEVWRDQPYDNKSDIWSLGCVLYESITLKPPFRADDMQGLYKKVLRGVYPKIPSVYSTDLANLVKSLIQVTPQMRPSCERILDLPIIRKRTEKLFPQDDFYDSQSSLLNTIRVPKNLLYLTDRLPKPSYESPTQYRKKIDEEERRRKTHDAGNMLLPELKNHNQGQGPPQRKLGKGINGAVNSSVDAITMNQQQIPQVNIQQQQKETAGRKSRKSNGGGAQGGKQVRVRSDLRQSAEDNGSPDGNYNPGDDVSVKLGTGASQAGADEERGSVVSKGSIGNQKQIQSVLPSQREQPALNRKPTNKQADKKPPMSHRSKESHQIVVHHQVDKVADDYDNDQFEREEAQPSYSPPPKANIHADERESPNDSQGSPQYYQNNNVSPVTKRNQITKIQPSGQHLNQLNAQHPVPSGQLILQNRPQVNYSLNRGPSEISGGPQSVERIYIQKNPSSLPSLVDQQANSQSRKNLAYINISSEGAKPVGYLGLKKAEKDLIMRRYKYNHHVSDHIQRVALIYGNPHTGNSHSQHPPQYQVNYLGQGNQNHPTSGLSPYLQSQLNSINQGNNLQGAIKRNKYAPSQIIEENSNSVVGRGQQEQMKLPKIGGSVGRHNEIGLNQQSQGMLPPIGAGSLGSGVNGQSILTKNPQSLQHLQQQQIGVGLGYQPQYALKAPKMKSIPRPLLVPAQGVSGERINLNKYSLVQPDKETMLQPLSNLGGGSVSRSHQIQSIGQSQASNNAGEIMAQPSQKELRKIYQRKTKPANNTETTGQSASRSNRNMVGGARSGIGQNHSVDNAAADNGDEYEEQ